MAGGPALDRALADVSEELADSSFEYAMRDLYRGGGLRPYRSPFPFRCPDGVVIRLDVAFPWAWVATECDTRGFHSDVAPFNADQVRWSQAIQGGWALTWATWDRLERDPAGLLADVRALLARADRSRPPAMPAL